MALTACSRKSVLNAALAWLSLCFIAAAFSPAQATERETLQLQQNDRKWPITTVTINGQSTPALLDTGATIALIDDDLLTSELTEDAPFETRVLG
ncbi:MAG: hypothetical protein AAF331_15615, partial [Pseudomonadota bacterium]